MWTSQEYARIFLCCLMTAVGWGLTVAFSVFMNSLVDDFSSSYTFMSFIGSGALAVQFLVGSIPAIMVEKLGYGPVTLISGLLVASGFFLSSYDVYSWELIFTYMILVGIATGATVIIFSFLIESVPEDHPTAIGIATSGAGLGTIFFIFIATRLTIEGQSWRLIFRYFSIAGLAVAVSSIGYFVFDSSKRKLSQSPDEITPILANENATTTTSEAKHGVALLISEDRRSLRLFISNAIMFISYFIPIEFCMVYIAKIDTDGYADFYYMGAVVGSFLIVGSLFVAFLLNQQIGSAFMLHKISMIGCAMSTGAIAVMPYTETDLAYALMWIAVYALFQSSFMTLLPLRVTQVLGTDGHAMNIGLQWFAVGFGVIIGGICAGYIYDATYNPEWVYGFASLGFMLAIVVDEMLFPAEGIVYLLLCCESCSKTTSKEATA